MTRPASALAGLAAVLALSSACSGVKGTDDLEYVGGDGKVVEVAKDKREDPVEISGETVQGEPLDISDLRGKAVVLNVWWSGCGPCRSEMPMLVDAEKELGKDEVAFVGINIRDLAPENAAAFENDRGVDYPSLYDPGSETLGSLGRYETRSVPATYVLDTEGRVAALMNGPVPSKSTLVTLVEDVLAESD